jgi:hypothetical protein
VTTLHVIFATLGTFHLIASGLFLRVMWQERGRPEKAQIRKDLDQQDLRAAAAFLVKLQNPAAG